MITQSPPIHWWTNRFWDDTAEVKPWIAKYSEEKRRVFEIEVEAMMADSFPQDLSPLLESYRRCNWTQQPTNAGTDLHNAIVVAAYCETELDANEVLGQLHAMGSFDAETGITTPPPPVQLPFPKAHLESFIKDLKYYAFVTIWHFFGQYPHFLTTLRPGMLQALHEEVFEIAVELLLAKLQASAQN